jgi:hypothetical protein
MILNEVESVGVTCRHHDSKMDGVLLNHGSVDERCRLDDGRGGW